MNLSVSTRLPYWLICSDCPDILDEDNGWLKAHPLPADKSSYGNFEALAQQNQQVIQRIMESSDEIALESKDPYDEEVLKKIRDMYTSCLNESLLDGIGGAPLEHFVRTIRKLFRGEDTEIGRQGKKRKFKGLTAALAFLHSQGVMNSLMEEHHMSSSCVFQVSVLCFLSE